MILNESEPTRGSALAISNKLSPPALRGDYNKWMLVVDDSNLFHAQYRAPMYQTNIKTDNAFDAVKDQYFSDEGVGISLIESHSLFKITA